MCQDHGLITHAHNPASLGNMFYLVLPTEQGESVTDDPNDPPTPTAAEFPKPLEEVTSPQAQSDEVVWACCSETEQSEAAQQGQEEETGTGKSQTGHQSHVIKNVDEIFHTIEGLMSKLHHLRVSSIGLPSLKMMIYICVNHLYITHLHI